MKRWCLWFVLLTGCSTTAADHERLGDVAYDQGDYPTAVEEYRTAAQRAPTARVAAKLGAAALKTLALGDAAEAYDQLARLDPTRTVEAARGLEQVARAADREGSGAALQAAVTTLRRLAPERVNHRYTTALMRDGALEPPEAAGLGPLALAAAGDAAAVDQMLVDYAGALAETTACGESAEAYLAALRRTHDAALRRRAIAGLGRCGVQLGLEALTVDRPEVALRWFSRITELDSTSEAGRRALIGLGDARVTQGDLLGASIAYEDARRPGASDSIVAIATERLGRLGAGTAPPDSVPQQ